MIIQKNSPQALSGSVQKHGVHALRQVKNQRVTANAKRPATLSNMPVSAMKSQNKGAYNARVSKRYPGWGQTVKGYEAGKCGS